MPQRFRVLTGAILVAAFAIAFGWPARNGGIIAGDDERLAIDHVYVNHPSWANAARLLTIVHGDLYQPVPVLTFQLNYALVQPTPTNRIPVSLYGFHLTNIFLHGLNAALVFLIASRLAECRRIGLVTALMFASHPFAVEPVAWISGRTILLAAAFSLLFFLALPLRTQTDSKLSIAASIVVWLLALGSKVLPTVPVAAIWCDLRMHGQIPRRRWSVYFLLLAISAAATWLVYRATHEAGFIAAMEAEPADPLLIRMLLAARYYIENYVWPSRLAGWSPPPLGFTLSSPSVLIAIGEILALLMLIAVTWRRNRIIGLGLGLFFILIVPFLAASAARRFLAADRYMYLPILGLHLALAASIVALFDELRRRSGPVLAWLATGLPAAAILAGWFAVGWQLGPTWANNVLRNQRAADVYHDNVLAHVELAKAYVIERRPDEALSVVAKARTRWPDHPRLAGVAGEAYRLKKDWPAAERELRRAAAGLPHHLWTLYYLARTLDDSCQTADARQLYRNILEQHPGYLPALIALARSYEKAGEIDAAIDAYQRAIEVNPHDPACLTSLALLRIKQQEWARAEPMLRSLLKLEPDDPSALLNLGVVLSRTNRTSEAMQIYDRLLTKDSANVTARLNRAALLLQSGRTADAEADYRAILKANPAHRAAAVGLHELLQQQHRFLELPALWRGVAAADNKGDVRAWTVWAETLAGNSDGARRTAATIEPTSPDRPFSQWALAYDSLRHERLDDFQAILDSLVPARPISDVVQEQARVIRSALLDLPEKTRESPAGLYALAHALLYDSHIATAQTVLSRIVESEQKGSRWAQAAQSLLLKLPRAATQSS